MHIEEDISPWRLTEHEDPQQIRKTRVNIRKMPQNVNMHQESEGRGGQGSGNKHHPFQISIISPQLTRSRSIQEASLPKLSSKYEVSRQRRSSFRSTQWLPIAKSHHRLDVYAKNKKNSKIDEAATQLLRIKLQSLLKQGDPLPSPPTLPRNISQSPRKKQDSIVIRQQNIVFLYSPQPKTRVSQASPKKKQGGHLLDKLLSAWK